MCPSVPSALVVATAVGGYVMAPLPLTALSLVGTCVGTALISAAANTTNQILESPYDAQMKRTSNRVLVKGEMLPRVWEAGYYCYETDAF